MFRVERSAPHAKNTFSPKNKKVARGSSGVTLPLLLVSLLLKAPPPFSLQAARRSPRSSLPVERRQGRQGRRGQQQQNKRFSPLLPPPLSWWRWSAGARWAVCWETAWRRCTTTEERKSRRSNIWWVQFKRLHRLFFGYSRSYNPQSRTGGSSVNTNKDGKVLTPESHLIKKQQHSVTESDTFHNSQTHRESMYCPFKRTLNILECSLLECFFFKKRVLQLWCHKVLEPSLLINVRTNSSKRKKEDLPL